MRLSRRWAVMAGLAVAGMALSVVASAAPRDRGLGTLPMAYAPGAGFDAGSVLLTAPRSGAPILIWSLDDGFSRKLVWSKFVGNHWSSPRPMTFGTGDDLAPVAGISSTGSVLFWVDDHGRLFYAPFDPESGNLHAVPQPVTLGSRRGSDPRPEGGSDAPVILVYCDAAAPVQPCLPAPPAGGGSGSHNGLPPRMGLEGGSDAPVVLSTGGTSKNNLAVASHPGCSSQILAAASDDSVSVLAFDGAGRSSLVGEFRLGPEIDRKAAVSAIGERYLRQICR
ncbi:MAG TPA: hypothetical protein VMQ62_06390 [Dongiaceae bacterium]|nr:hypothetical protein [Dongiaceae bacterium]